MNSKFVETDIDYIRAKLSSGDATKVDCSIMAPANYGMLYLDILERSVHSLQVYTPANQITDMDFGILRYGREDDWNALAKNGRFQWFRGDWGDARLAPDYAWTPIVGNVQEIYQSMREIYRREDQKRLPEDVNLAKFPVTFRMDVSPWKVVEYGHSRAAVMLLKGAVSKAGYGFKAEEDSCWDTWPMIFESDTPASSGATLQCASHHG